MSVVPAESDTTDPASPSTGLGAPISALDDALAAEASTVAVVGDPFSRRGRLLDAAADQLTDARRVHPDGVLAEDLPTFPDAPAVLVEDCQLLFSRRVGGFGALDDLVSRLTADEVTAVLGWNRQAWAYVTAVHDVGRIVDTVVDVPPLDREEVESFLDERYDLPPFAAEQSPRPLVSVEPTDVRVPLLGEKRAPVPRIDVDVLREWRVDESDPRDAVFERVRRLSRGNPGAAAAVWEHSVGGDGDAEGGPVTPSDVAAPVETVVLDEESAFVLWVVVSKETVSRDHLARVTRTDQLDAVVADLHRQGVVAVDGDEVSLAPRAVGPAVEALERRRFVW